VRASLHSTSECFPEGFVPVPFDKSLGRPILARIRCSMANARNSIHETRTNLNCRDGDQSR
jgi:hypothetical protein